MPKKYKHIEILDGTYFANKIKITYEDGTIEEIEASEGKKDTFNECWDYLVSFAEQEKFVSELGIADVSKFLESEFVTRSEKKEETKETEEYGLDETHEDEEHKVSKTGDKKEDKNKKGRWKIRLGATGLAILMGIGGYVIGRNNRSNKNNNSYIQIIDKTSEDNMTYEEKLIQLSNNSRQVVANLEVMIKGEIKNSEDLDQCITDIANVSLANVTEISNYVTGRTSSITGNMASVNLREAFVNVLGENSVDYSAVNYFNGLRDAVVNAAYTKKSVDETKKCVAKFDEEFVNFVFGNKMLVYNMNGQKVYYKFADLEPSVKMTILTMGTVMLNIEQDFNIDINGEKYNRIIAITEACELNKTIYQELASIQQYSRTK